MSKDFKERLDAFEDILHDSTGMLLALIEVMGDYMGKEEFRKKMNEQIILLQEPEKQGDFH